MKAICKKNTVVGFLILFLLLVTCKKEEGNVSGSNSQPTLSGLVLFAVGEVKVGDRKLKAGDMILENEVVLTGKKSSCDVQLKDSDAGIVIRVKSDSSFALKMTNENGKQVPSTLVNVGNAMVNVSGKLKNDENFQVVTPTQTAGVRGTKFEVNVTEDGSTRVSVSEGKVATKVRVKEVDELPTEVQEKSKIIASLKTTLNSEERIIEAGYFSQVNKKQTDQILQTTGLGDTIEKSKIKTSAPLNPEEAQSAANVIDNLKGGKLTEKISAQISKENASQKIDKIPSGEIQTKLKEYAELIAIEKRKLESKETTQIAVKERNEKNEEILIQRMQEITGKSFETLNLKSGKKVRGIIFNENDTYYVITPNGQETYQENEIEGLEL